MSEPLVRTNWGNLLLVVENGRWRLPTMGDADKYGFHSISDPEASRKALEAKFEC